MMLELVGSRLLAPYFGNSLFVWTSLIGVMLGFMSLGYFLGGRLADRHLSTGVLFWILAGAAVSVALVAFTEGSLLPKLAVGRYLRLLAVVSAALLFAVPSTLLGMVSPYCIRLRMHSIEDSGSTVGSLYALSTLGSIVGTFAAGFWLIAMLGTHDLVLALAVALGGLSLLVLRAGFEWRRITALGVLALLAVMGYSGVAQGAETIDTNYDRYFIREGRDTDGAPLIGLSRDNVGAESASYVLTGAAYRFDYYNYYDMAADLAGPVQRALLIGGGTFSYPRLFAAANPDAEMDAVEIDPALYDIAKQRFGYTDNRAISIFLEDGRTFLNHAQGPYDAVFMDAFKSEATVPYQLTTRESWAMCADVLDDDGVLVMNVIASPTDSRAPFFHALYATIEDVFPQVAAFRVQGEDGDGPHNTMIVALKNPDGDIMEAVQKTAPQYAANLLAGYKPPAGTRILTDDFAPVDQYLLGF